MALAGKQTFATVSAGTIVPAVAAVRSDLAPKFYPVLEFALAVGFARMGGGSDGSWRGAFGIAQRLDPRRGWQVMANSDGVLHPSCECGRVSLYNNV